jgi:hypothetical protein
VGVLDLNGTSVAVYSGIASAAAWVLGYAPPASALIEQPSS